MKINVDFRYKTVATQSVRQRKIEVAQEDLVTRTHLVGYLFRAYFTNCEAGEGGD